MSWQEFPLGGQDRDYNSRKTRAELVNMLTEGDGESVVWVRRAEGLEAGAGDTGEARIRSDLLLVAGLTYFVAGDDLYQVDRLGNTQSLGTIGGSGRCVLAGNNNPGDNEILVLNGLGEGFTYKPSAGLNKITDSDFKPSYSVTVLNERFWLQRDGTNEFFASDVADGQTYSTTSFASAESSPDNVEAVIAKNSALWVLGTNTIEYWQSISDDNLPVRQVKGGGYERGIVARNSLADTGDAFCWLADDKTVRMMTGNNMQKISSAAFDLEVKGDGTASDPGYEKVDDAYGFFVDGPVHKIYYLTFPTEEVTWGYDLTTGLWHKRESKDLGYWRVNGAVQAYDEVICGDSQSGKLYYLRREARDEAGTEIKWRLRTPGKSWMSNVTIPLVEVDMETGVGTGTGSGTDPQMGVRYSKDGGRTWTNKGMVSLGKAGNYTRRVPIRQLGRVVRTNSLEMEFYGTDPVEVRFYRLYADVQEGM